MVDPTLTSPLPLLGTGVASHGQPLSRREIATLRALRLVHLGVDLDLTTASVAGTLWLATQRGRQLGVPLAKQVSVKTAQILRWSIYDSPDFL